MNLTDMARNALRAMVKDCIREALEEHGIRRPLPALTTPFPPSVIDYTMLTGEPLGKSGAGGVTWWSESVPGFTKGKFYVGERFEGGLVMFANDEGVACGFSEARFHG